MDARAKMHWTTRIGVVGVVLCVAVVVSLNVVGWLNTLPGPPGIAAAFVAVGLELIAFVAWEHICKYGKTRDLGRLLLAIVGLALAAAVNIEGGHRGIEHLAAPLYAEAEADRRASQAALDAERAAIGTDIAALQTRVDAAAPNCADVGPETCRSRTEAWQALTTEDRAAITAARMRLEGLPISVSAREPFPSWGPYALTAAFAFMSLFGLTMFGVRVDAPREPAPPLRPSLSASRRRVFSGANILRLPTRANGAPAAEEPRHIVDDPAMVARAWNLRHRQHFSRREVADSMGVGERTVTRLWAKAEQWQREGRPLVDAA